MKKYVLILVSVFTIYFTANSQTIDDALRYSRVFYSGTARFTAMGGAFTSLGADLSSISLNPAGTGMYRTFELTITPQMFFNNSSSVFYGTKSTDYRYAFGLNQVGIVTSLLSKDITSGLKSLNFAYSFQKTNNFNENITVEGISTNSSMADYWAISASSDGGRFKNDLSGIELNAAKAWLIDTITGHPRQYATVFSNYGNDSSGGFILATYGQKIRRIISNEGYSGEHSFSIGGNFSDKIYFGATLGISKLNYTGHYEHLETYGSDLSYELNNFTYTDHFQDVGTGYSLKLGAIIRPIEMLRIGVAFHSPTVYRIHEYYDQNLSSEFNTPDSEGNYSYPNLEVGPYRYDYTLTTPMKFMLGASVQLKKLGVFSADYELVDYKMARLSNGGTDHYDFYAENLPIKNSLKAASNLRLGAEFRITNLYLRGGYGFYGSAFKKVEVNSVDSYNSLSCGIGFRQQNFFLDMGFSTILNNQKKYLYYDPGFLESASVKTSKNTFVTTFGFKF
jgi:hypothetical protein